MGNHLTSSFRPLILFAEDEEDFFIVTRYALEHAGFAGILKLVRSSKELMKHLQDGENPHLIILDMNNRPSEWREALKSLERDERYRSIPIVVLMFPIDPKDIALCESHSRCSYFERPADFEEWRACMEEILRKNLKAPSI